LLGGRDVTGYKKGDPAVAGGVGGNLTGWTVRERSGMSDYGLVRFKEAFKRQYKEAGFYDGKQLSPAHPVNQYSF
jgi:hypothetical protein